ncbi:YER137C [Saccharomyces arboricola H-6]|uniref:YER137C n=1 Tax=Saccharomyces arboricola (strain H-6 / AS 2.3317 / CBS 10644) TaxID=1160507 RepID=J8LPB7_SACAR|nr:YER137C [Saccharomyces arboricola H-6]
MSKVPTKTEDDIIRLSRAMDALAKLIISKQKDGFQLQVEYKHKLEELEKVINLLLGLNNGSGSSVTDTNALDSILRNGIEIVEKDNQEYALIPIKRKDADGSTNTAGEITSKRSSKKKKNRIKCSFCHNPGHTRAHCIVKLTLPPKE